MKERVKILVVEDEPKLAAALVEGLRAERYEVSAAATGEEGFFLLYSHAFDLVLLDVMLPGRSGYEVLTQIRRNGVQVAVLLLTARDSIEDRVHGLDLGADDYLVKPFAFPELLARCRALVRRGSPERPPALMLALDVWKETGRATPIDNVIDVHIARLRRKLDDPFERKLLHTVRGVGFILREDP